MACQTCIVYLGAPGIVLLPTLMSFTELQKITRNNYSAWQKLIFVGAMRPNATAQHACHLLRWELSSDIYLLEVASRDDKYNKCKMLCSLLRKCYLSYTKAADENLSLNDTGRAVSFLSCCANKCYRIKCGLKLLTRTAIISWRKNS